MKRFISSLLILLVLLSPLSTTAFAEETELFPLDFHALACEGQFLSPLFRALPDTGVFHSDHPGYGAQLEDEIALLAYTALETQLAPGVDRVNIDLSNYSISNWSTEVYSPMLAAVAAYVFDHPESQYCTFSGYGKSGTEAVYVISQPENAQERKAALDAVLSSFSSTFDSSLSTSEQYKFIHDYICELATYDQSATEPQSHTAYGLLVDRKPVVCEGYSKSFKLLCDTVGLPCILVSGESAWDTTGDGIPDFSGVSNHMWNAVCIDNHWYHVDTTWDDIDGYTIDTYPNLELSLICYDYFLNNDPFLSTSSLQNHQATGNIYYANNWPMCFGLPECPTGQYAVYNTNKLTITVTGDKLTIPSSLWNCSIDSIALNTIPDVTILLPQNISLSSPLSVPSGKSYTLSSVSNASIITRTSDFDGALFDLSGNLTLADVTISSTEASQIIATLNGGILTDLQDPELATYLSYTGSATGFAIGYQASYDAFCQMLTIEDLGSFQLTGPGLYAVNSVPIPDNATSTKQFLLSPDTFIPLTACIEK